MVEWIKRCSGSRNLLNRRRFAAVTTADERCLSLSQFFPTGNLRSHRDFSPPATETQDRIKRHPYAAHLPYLPLGGSVARRRYYRALERGVSGRAIRALQTTQFEIDRTLLRHLSPLGWEHINLTGDRMWWQNRGVGAGKYRSLRFLRVPDRAL